MGINVRNNYGEMCSRRLVRVINLAAQFINQISEFLKLIRPHWLKNVS